MRRAVFRAAALTLWRDKPALALTFLLPPLIFTIFALVFASATGGDISIRLGVYADDSDLSQELVATLEEAPEITTLVRAPSREELKSIVQTGDISAGIEIIRYEDDPVPDFRLYKAATRQAAALTAEKALSRLRPEDEEVDLESEDEIAREPVLEGTFVNPVNADVPMAAYYAAGVSVFFLLLSGFQTALSVIEERDAGVGHRLMASKAGLGPMIDGKFLFITAQGVVQSVVILAAAALLFNVTITFAPLSLIMAVFGTSLASAGVVLSVTMLCRSRAQAHAVGAILSLVLACIGGSMAPSFLMPAYMQTIGGATPIGLGIETYSISLWRGGGFMEAWPPALLLATYGIVGLISARLLAPSAIAAD